MDFLLFCPLKGSISLGKYRILIKQQTVFRQKEQFFNKNDN
jgi:hypothetical protein